MLLLALAVVLPAYSNGAGTLRKRPAQPATASSSDSVVVYGPVRFTHANSNTSLWLVSDDAFEADTTHGRRYVLEVVNGSSRVSGMTFANASLGREFVGTSDFGTGTTSLLRTIDVLPGESNNIEVAVKGPLNSYVTVRIVKVWDPTFRVFGRKTYVRPSVIAAQADTFTMPLDAGYPYTLWALNGDTNTTAHRLTNATVSVNGTQVMSSSDFGTGRATASKQVNIDPDLQNIISLYNQSAAGTKATFWVTGTGSVAPQLAITSPTDTVFTTTGGVRIIGSVSDHLYGVVKVAGNMHESPCSFSDTLTHATDGTYQDTVYAINSAKYDTVAYRVVVRDSRVPTFTALSPAADTTVSVDNITIAGSWADTTRTYIRVNGDTVGVGKYSSFSRSVTLDQGSNRIYVDATDRVGHVNSVMRLVWRAPATCTTCDTSGRGVTPLTATEVASFRNQIGFLFRGSSPIQSGADTTRILNGSEAVIRGYVCGRDYGALPGVTVSVLGHPEYGATRTLNDGWFDLAVTAVATPYTIRFHRDNLLEAQRQVVTAASEYAIVDTVAMIGRSNAWYYVDTTYAASIVGRFESDSTGSRRIYITVPKGDVATITPSGGSPLSGITKYRVRLKEFTVGSGGPATMPGDLPAASAYTYCVDMSLVEADSVTDHAGSTALPAGVSFSKPIVTYVKDYIGLPIGTVMPSGYYDPIQGRWIADENGIVFKVLSTGGGVASLDTDGNGTADTLAQYTSLGIDTLELTQIASHFRVGDVLWRDRVTHFTAHDFNQNTGTNGGLGPTNSPSAGVGSPLIGDPEKTCACVIENENRVLGETIPVKGTPFELVYRSSRQFGDIASRWLRVPLTGSTVPTGLQRVQLQVDVAGHRYQTIYTGITANDVRVWSGWDGTDVYGRRVPGSVTATVRLGYDFQQSYALYTTSTHAYGNASGSASGIGHATTGDQNVPDIAWATQKVSIGAPSMASAGLGGWTLSPHNFYDVNGRGALYLGDGSVRYGLQQYPTIHLFAGYPASGLVQDGSLDTTVFRLAQKIAPGPMAFGPDGSLYYIDVSGGHHMVYRLRPNGTTIPWAGCATCYEGDPTNDPSDGSFAVSTTKRLAGLNDLAVGPDGSVYLSDGTWQQVYRVTPDDTLHVVCGKYSLGYGSFVEGAVAKTHAMRSPSAVGAGPDGSIYIADAGFKRVVRIAADGLMHSFAGDSCCVSATSGKADSIMLGSSGAVSGIAVSPHGEVYLADGTHVWMVTPDGQMRQISAPDHGCAKLALGPDGALYIGTGTGYNGIVRRETDGTLSTIAGTYPDVIGGAYTPADFVTEEGGYAAAARMEGMGGLAVAPDGKLYEAQDGVPSYAGGYGIRIITPEAPGQLNSEIAYPSAGGNQVSYFTLTGQHKRTMDVATGDTLYAFSYNAAGRLSGVRDGDGNVTTIQRGSDGSPLAIVGPFGQRLKLGLDANGYLSSVSDSAASLSYSMDYSADGLLEHFTNPRGKEDAYTYNSNDGRLHYDRDASGATQTLTNVDGGLTQTVTRTTQETRVTTYQVTRMLDGLRRRLVHYPDGGTSYRADSMNTGTSPYGNVTLEITPTGERVTTYPTRDQRYGVLAEGAGTVVTTLPSGLARTESASRDTATGGVVTETHTMNGRTFTATFNRSHSTWVTTSPEGTTSRDSLDATGRPVLLTVGDGNSGLSPIILAYDSEGRLTKLEQGGRGWRYGYDGTGRLAVVRDTLGRMMTYGYDAANRVTTQVLPGNRTVSYAYDGKGNLTSLTPPGGSAHIFGYSDVDLIDIYTPPSVADVADPSTRYTFNSDRQLTQVSRPDGTLINARYSVSKGLLDSLTLARGESHFTYAVNGPLVTASSPDGVTVTYGYDGQTLRSEAWSGLFGGASIESVSVLSNIAFADSVEFVNGTSPAAVTYNYDDMLVGVTINNVTETITRRGNDGLVSGTSVGNVTSSHSYNNHGELWKLSYSWPGGGGFQQVLDRDSLGRVVRVTESGFVGHTYDYHYDDGGRLDSVAMDGSKVAGYSYDGNGNRVAYRGAISSDTVTATFDAQDRMLRYGGARYAYTGGGEALRKVGVVSDTSRYTYDAFGNLIGAHLPGGDSLVYTIDAENRRVARTVNGARTNAWVYGNGLDVIAELDTAGGIVNRYVYGMRAHVPDLVVCGGVTCRVISDQLGSVRAIVQVSNGEILQRADYDAWGARTFALATTVQSLGFVGGLWDSLTGLTRLGARDYASDVGRWLAKDHNGSGDAVGGYAYASDDPIDLVDVTGLTPRPVGGSGLSPDDLRHSAACTGTIVGESIGPLELWERLKYYSDMVSGGKPFDPLDNAYGDGLSQKDAEDLGNELAGVLAGATKLPWWLTIDGAKAHHLWRAYKNKRFWSEVGKSVGRGSILLPGDEEAERKGYLEYSMLYEKQCGCKPQ